MATRRILLALIGLLSACILIGGTAVAALAFFGLRNRGGELVIVGADRRLLLVDRGGRERVLAEDASPDLFTYPTLAPDGERIAYVSQDIDGFALRSMDLRTGSQIELYRSSENPPFYAAWSPDGANISFIASRGAGGLDVHVVAADGSCEADLLGSAPGSSYFAWQPGGGRLLLHIGGSSFEDGRMAAYEAGSTTPLYELADPGFFQAPAWTADGSGFFYVAQPQAQGPPSVANVESVLTRVAADGTGAQELAREKMVAMLFLRAPQSDAIAYTTIGPDGFGALKLVDAGGGAARILSRADEQVPAFFWAPGGEQLAYLTLEASQPGGPPRFTWHLVDLARGQVRDLESFTSSWAFASLVKFFDAYAISFDLWSPDGRELAFGADDGVYVLDVRSGEVRRRADGVLGMWTGRR